MLIRFKKTRIAYGTHANGETYILGDTVKQALEANMAVKDYEKALVAANPQLKITFQIEKIREMEV